MSRTGLSAVVIAALCLAAWCVRVGGQQQQQQPGTGPQSVAGEQPMPLFGPPPPATRLEALASQKGVLITKGYTDIGDVQADDGSRIRLTAVHFADARQAVEQGLVVTIEQRGVGGDDAPAPVVTYIDLDEFDALADALDALAKMESTAGPLANVEGVFHTRGDLEFTNHSSNGGRAVTVRATQILIPSGQVLQASATLRPARLAEIRQQIAASKETLQRAREPAAAEK